MSVIVGVALQVLFHDAAFFAPDFALVALITVGFFISFRELLPFIIFAAWILNWQPAAGLPIILFVGIPLLFFFLKRISPWHAWLTNLVGTCLAMIIFYAGDRAAAFAVPRTSLIVIVVDLFFAAALFEFLKRFQVPSLETAF